MRACISTWICRFGGYFFFKIFRRLVNKILVLPEQLNRVKEIEKLDVPIVYLPLHRSHLDYLVLTWTVWHWQIKLPFIASGDNLNLSGLGWLLRSFGAFFIRRRYENPDVKHLDYESDKLYRNVLNTYMIHLLQHNMSIEFFLEGTRSRFGKTLIPKNGLISNIVTAVQKGQIKDAYLVPVSVTYDSIIEGIFYDELMGLRKKRESIWMVIKAFFVNFIPGGKCGDVVINIGQPISLNEHLKFLESNIKKYRENLFNLNYETNPNSYRELLPWHHNVIETDQHIFDRMLIRAVGYDIVYQSQKQKPVIVCSLIALLFLAKYRHSPISESHFFDELNTLVNEMIQMNYYVLEWSLVDVERNRQLFQVQH